MAKKPTDEIERLKRQRARQGGYKLNTPTGDKGFMLLPGPAVTGFFDPNQKITSAMDYDGAADYAVRGGALTGIANGKQGLFSCWFRLDGGDGVNLPLLRAIGGDFISRIIIDRQASQNKIFIRLRSTSATILELITTLGYLASPAWLHILCAWDLNILARHLYINDAVPALSTNNAINANIDYTGGNYSIGGTDTGGFKFNGCISEMFFHTSYLDLSIISNRRKFITTGGGPVNLGVDGSIPLGVQPLLYIPDGNPADNKGTGGNFTVTGVLDTCSTTPSS